MSPLRGRVAGAGLMNAVEIEEAVSALAEQPFDAQFPFAFLTAFGNKETTVKRAARRVVQFVGRARRGASAEEHPYRDLRPRNGRRDGEAGFRAWSGLRTLAQGFERFFSVARLEMTIKDRFGNPVKPRQWFLAPLPVIDEVVKRIKNETIVDYEYDPASASLKRRTRSAATRQGR
jgi:hypothetical protein